MAKILVGLSGGVDSAVAAYLLKKQGHDVTGGFMRNWDSSVNNDILGNPDVNNDVCPQEEDYADAKRVAESLNIPLVRVDFIKEYWDNVFQVFIKEYQKGRTPNPDILCNKHIKFDSFLKYAMTNGYDYIATGHYVDKIEINNKWFLKKALDHTKDQSYFLSALTHEQIEKSLFPLGNITKKEVREIATSLNLNVATKKDSTGICFIGERDFRNFLANYLPLKNGDIIDIHTGNKLGTHKGSMYYTLGQRKGLGIGGIAGIDSASWFVVDKDIVKNIVYVTSGKETDFLYSTELTVSDINVLVDEKDINCTAKFRYRQEDNKVNIKIEDNIIKVKCESPVKATTPGQQAVFYLNDVLIASGTIETVDYKWKK